ncbi:MAG: VanW family protein [Clostridia bacterium]|nr:VanW family protein [Clostridia bacterium]
MTKTKTNKRKGIKHAGAKKQLKTAPGKARIHKKSAAGKGTQKSRKRRTHCWWALPVACLMLVTLLISAIFVIHEVGEYRRFQVMRSAVESGGYYTGIVVDGYSLAGVTREHAYEFWRDSIESPNENRTISLSYAGKTWTKTARDLGYTSDYEEVLNHAWAIGRDGTLEERYRSITSLTSVNARFEVKRRMFDNKLLKNWTDEIASSLSTSSKNASVTGFDLNTKTFTLSSSSAGTSVDKDALYKEALSVLQNGGGTVAVNVETVDPAVKEQDFKSKFGMITSAVTNASSSNSNRLTNLRLACAAINGYCVEPGATFSFNEVVGQRTSKRGYKIATVYQSGEIAEDLGGGICQVSTTLWNAAMKANCEIVEWHEHSRPVSYVDRGKDATVSWGTQDMKFKNTSSYPMYIIAYITENKRVYCEIYGELFPDGKYITIEAKTTQRIDPGEPEYVYNPLLSPGETVTISGPRTGYRAKAYRVYWNADGTEIKRDLLVEAYYRAKRGTVEYG